MAIVAFTTGEVLSAHLIEPGVGAFKAACELTLRQGRHQSARPKHRTKRLRRVYLFVVAVDRLAG